mmetsp:Transcript_19776/g.62921  ORF Transcript_19776/g.62921 Transcript_19776/m.62921 type:complete len:220 (-) Transcript_19776:1382-2041(-)
MSTRVHAEGRTSTLNTCLPVQSSMGLRTVGDGRSMASMPSPIMEQSIANCARSTNTSLDVMRKAEVRKSWLAAISTSPFLGVARLACTPMRWMASALASSVCGRCRFISSPSKSALYGLHTHSLKRNVLQGITRARCAMMDILCREGWRLKSTTSPSSRCRSTTSPMLSSAAMRRLSPYLRYHLPPSGKTTKLAPGCAPIPLMTQPLSFSMLYWDTRSG